MKILSWGIYIIVFCLPLYLVRFKVFGIPTTTLELMIYGLFLFWLVKKGYKKLLAIFKSNRLLFYSIAALFIGVSLSTIFSWDLRISAGIWKAWFVDPLLFFAVLITTINQEEIKKVLNAFVFSGLTVSIISLVCLVLDKLDVHGRLQGIYNSPNYLAMYLAPCLLACIGYFKTRKNIMLNTFVLFFVVCLLVSIFFTKSYGAGIGLIAAICFFLFLKANKYFKFILVLLAVISVIILITFLVGTRGISYGARWVIWDKAFEVFRQYPLFGIGPGTFESYFPPYPKWGVPQPHSIYFAFLLQTGIIGFVGFIWLLVLFFKRGFKTLATNYWLLVPVIMSVMVYILVHGLVDTLYWKNDLSVFFWVIIGLMVVLSRPESGEK